LRVGDASSGAENTKELVAFPADTAKEAEFLEDQSPGDERESQKKQQDAARDPAGLLEDAKDIGNEKCRRRKSDVDPSEMEIC